MSPEELEKCKKARTEFNENNPRDYDGECSFCVVMPDGHFHEYYEAACHAPLSREQNTGSIGVVSLIENRKIKGNKVRAGYTLKFYRWLLNESPYAFVFVTKCPHEAVKEGVICRSDVPNNMLAGGLIATRNPWEYPNIIYAWWELSKRKVNKNLAFIIAHSYRKDAGNVMWDGGPQGHVALYNDYFSYSRVKPFITNSLEGLPLEANYEDSVLYRGIHNTWYSDGPSMYYLVEEAAKEFITEVRGKKGLLGYRSVGLEEETSLNCMAKWAKGFYKQVMEN